MSLTELMEMEYEIISTVTAENAQRLKQIEQKVEKSEKSNNVEKDKEHTQTQQELCVNSEVQNQP